MQQDLVWIIELVLDTKTRWDNRKWQIQHNGCHFKGSEENGAEYICQPKILHRDSAASLREGVGGFLSSYPSPGSLQDLEVAGQGRYLFPKSPYTRSAIKQLMGLSFSYTRKQKIWLSLKIIRAAKSPPAFPSQCHRSYIGDSAPVNCSWQGRRLLPHKLEILKHQSLLFLFHAQTTHQLSRFTCNSSEQNAPC